MGYAAEKKIAERKWAIAKRIALFALLFIVVALCILSAFYPAETWKYYFKLPKTGVRADGEMRIHFIDVGQGDATLIELPDGRVMLIDSGAEGTNSKNALMRYLNALKIDTVDYFLITHADADHCGGADAVIDHKEIKRAFLPLDNTTDGAEYAQAYTKLRKHSVPIELTSRNTFIETNGLYTLGVLYPYSYGSEEKKDSENEDSAVVWLDYKGVSAIFTGDAPFSVEERLMTDDALGVFAESGIDLKSTEILKVAHHGSNDSTGRNFVEYLGVKTSVISCGVNNAYFHPAAALIERLVGTDVYRTDTDGSVIVTVSESGEYAVRRLGK